MIKRLESTDSGEVRLQRIDKAHVCGLVYKIEWIDTIAFEKGIINFDTQRINIQSNYGGQPASICLLHELVHAMMHENKIRPEDEETDEKVTSIMARSIYDFVVNNPELIDAMRSIHFDNLRNGNEGTIDD